MPHLYITYRTIQGKRGGVEGDPICGYRYPALASAFENTKNVLKWKDEPDYSKTFEIINKKAKWGVTFDTLFVLPDVRGRQEGRDLRIAEIAECIMNLCIFCYVCC